MFGGRKSRSRWRIKSVISLFLSVAMIGAGITLIAFSFLAGRSDSTATNSDHPGGFNVPRLENPRHPQQAVKGPKDKTLKMTIPAMNRVKNASVPDVSGSDEKALNSHVAIHLKGTGFPWQRTANVYIAGHRLGYVGTKSLLAFYDLNVLKDGDKVYITDANGTKYTYKVFKEFTVNPGNLSVTRPKPGENIVTLQTCTLPDYSHRLIVQAKLVKKTKKT